MKEESRLAALQDKKEEEGEEEEDVVVEIVEVIEVYGDFILKNFKPQDIYMLYIHTSIHTYIRQSERKEKGS
jgi:hypothetical protein